LSCSGGGLGAVLFSKAPAASGQAVVLYEKQVTHPFGPDALPETADDDPKRQVECWIAPSPSTRGRLFASWMDLSHTPLPTDGWGIGYGLSSDFGQSWGFFAVGDTDLVDVDIPPPTGYASWSPFQVDPGCAIGANDSGQEVLYLVGLDEVASSQGPVFSGIFFATYDVQAGWTAKYLATEDAPGWVDKPLVTADPSSDATRRKRAYVHWTQFPALPPEGQSQAIIFRRSLEAGADILQQSPFTLVYEPLVTAAVSAVGPGGDICVAWWRVNDANGNISDIRARTSIDPGAPVLVFTPETTAVDEFRAFRDEGWANFKVNSLPAIAVDNCQCARGGRYYIAYMGKEPAGDAGIYVAMSKNKGLCWETPVLAVADPPGNIGARQFMPGIAVNDKGHVGLMVYDTRDDPAFNRLFRVYFAYSKDGGLTFEAPVPVAGRLSDPHFHRFPSGLFVGDYNGMAAQGNTFYPIWADLRDWDGSDLQTPGDIWTAAVDVDDDPVGPPDFDWDCDVDLQDFTFFQNCFTGANPRPCDQRQYVGNCAWADFDGDGDIDLTDYLLLQQFYTGSGVCMCSGGEQGASGGRFTDDGGRTYYTLEHLSRWLRDYCASRRIPFN